MPERSSNVLSPKNWPFDLEWLPQPAYMVGGAVRDALLGRRREYLDLDFVLPMGAVKTARAIAHHYQAGFVLLDAERQIARVVFKQATADFAQQEGATLETDLQRRDFTVNAIAYNPRTQEIIDPLQGRADLQQGLLRMVSAANLQDDPLRLLRGYRQAAQLNFVIDSDTQLTIRQLSPLLGEVAAERVRVELGYLLNSPKGTSWLIAAGNDGLLTSWFNITGKQLERMAAADAAAVALTATWPTLAVESQSVREPLKTTLLSIAKLACLVASDAELAEAELVRLTYSRAEIRAVTTAMKLLPQLKREEVSAAQMSLSEQYFLFRTAGNIFPAVAVLAVADGMSVGAIAPLIKRYLTPDDPVAHPTPLVTGTDLMKALDLPSSPKIGQLLTAVVLAQIEGRISTSAAAIKFAAQLVDPQ